MTLIPPQRKTRYEQFSLLLTSIGCLVFAGIYWFVAGDDKECPTWAKIVGITVVLIGASLLVWGAYYLSFRWY